MKTKAKRTFYIIEAGEAFFKVAKGVESDSGKEFIAFQAVPCSTDSSLKVEDKIIDLLKGLGYRKDPVIFSLPRNLATLRYLKVPSRDPREIERMVAFQAPRHIPYQAEDLITGYELIRMDSEGFAHVNLVIVHKDTVAPYLKVCRVLKLSNPVILLSSFGLCRSFQAFQPIGSAPAIILDIDENHVEFAVSCQGALTFSRSLKFDGFQSGWPARLADELAKTLEAYFKEVGQERPDNVFLLGNKDLSRTLFEFLAPRTSFKVQELSLNGHIRLAESARNDFGRSLSFYSLVGLGLMEQKISLSLLPSAMKDDIRRRTVNFEHIKVFLIFVAAALFFLFGMGLDVHNKSMYLERLTSEFKRVRREAGPLEEIDRRVSLLKKGSDRSAGLDILDRVHQMIPAGVSLNTFEYDAAGKVVLRGQAEQIEEVFALAYKIEAADAFRGYVVAVNYATQRKTARGDMVDFEITAKR